MNNAMPFRRRETCANCAKPLRPLLAAVLLALPALAQAQFTYATNNGAITITGYTGVGTAVTIPGTINGLPVTSIGDSAFYSNASLTSLTIPAGVTDIGNSAFYFCTALTNAPLPSSVAMIENGAFAGCIALANLALPASLTNLGSTAFEYCASLTNFTIPAGLASIGDSALAYCDGLMSITVAGGNPAYSSADGVLFDLAQATLLQYPPASTGLVYTVSNTVTAIGDAAFADCATLTNIVLDSGVTAIGQGAFANCSSLPGILLPNGLLSIGDSAFLNCGALTNITIPTTVTNLGNGVFGGCFSLAAINVETGNPDYSSAGGVLFDASQATLFAYPDGLGGAYTVPGTVASIVDAAFAGSPVTSVILPNTLTNLGDWVFANCPVLTSVTFSGTFATLGQGAFYGCPSLAAVTIPTNVTTLGDQAFAECTALTNVVVSSNLTSIGSLAFATCPALEAITVDPNNPAYSSASGVLFDKAQAMLIQYPPANAGTSTVSYAVANTVTAIADGAFAGCTTLTNVTLPSGVTSIGQGSFESCTLLASAALPAGLSSLGDYAFAWCPTLAGAVLPAGVVSLGDYAFAGSATAGGLAIPEGVLSLGDYAFAGCAHLTSVSVPSSVAAIGYATFGFCPGLAAITVDPANAAYTSLNGVLLDKGQDTLMEYPAEGAGGLYLVPGTVTTIADYAFFGATNLTNITVSGSVTGIGADAFNLCINLKGGYFLGNAPALGGPYAFNPDSLALAYYLPGTSGWGAAYGGIPTAVWNATLEATGPAVNVTEGTFRFNVTGTPYFPITVQATTDLTGGSWTNLTSCSLTNGLISFTDPEWGKYAFRFYRITAP